MLTVFGARAVAALRNAREAGEILQPMPGAVQGIYAARLDLATGQLTAIGQVGQLNRAQWLTP